MAPAIAPDELVVVDVDLSLEPECESRYHEEQPQFHGGPATHVLRTPCSAATLVCAPFVNAVVLFGGTRCSSCKTIHFYPQDVGFIPL